MRKGTHTHTQFVSFRKSELTFCARVEGTKKPDETLLLEAFHDDGDEHFSFHSLCGQGEQTKVARSVVCSRAHSPFKN